MNQKLIVPAIPDTYPEVDLNNYEVSAESTRLLPIIAKHISRGKLTPLLQRFLPNPQFLQALFTELDNIISKIGDHCFEVLCDYLELNGEDFQTKYPSLPYRTINHIGRGKKALSVSIIELAQLELLSFEDASEISDEYLSRLSMKFDNLAGELALIFAAQAQNQNRYHMTGSAVISINSELTIPSTEQISDGGVAEIDSLIAYYTHWLSEKISKAKTERSRKLERFIDNTTSSSTES